MSNQPFKTEDVLWRHKTGAVETIFVREGKLIRQWLASEGFVLGYIKGDWLQGGGWLAELLRQLAASQKRIAELEALLDQCVAALTILESGGYHAALVPNTQTAIAVLRGVLAAHNKLETL